MTTPKSSSSTTSVREVARRAGVSVGTVSNVLNRPDLVASPTRDRVRRAIDELGFVRNESARQLRAGRSRTLGLIVLDITNPFFTDVARGVEDAASAAGLSVILCNSDDDPEKEARYVELLVEQRVQGILIVPAAASTRQPSLAASRGIPTILLDYYLKTPLGCSVSVDDVAGGHMAVRHLLDLGHTRIAFVGGGSSTQVADRQRGALKAAAATKAGHGTVMTITAPSLNVAGGREAAGSLLALPARERPSAVFCANDLIALGLLQELGASGLSVPGDISLVGYDDIEFAASAGVPLTSVRQPRQELGQVAAALLLEEAADPDHRHRQVVFDPELVIRASTGRPVS
ncbi:MAG TPA: LacI family DNA-binding transcriptional regulator [Acidimicrobiales bacterium]|nr:LacI family DNA-binding transcriptional regulator [Acidimicrobiales bacterium]